MKWSIIGLVAMGIVAALLATVLVASYRSDTPGTTGGGEGKMVTVLVASKAMSAITMVDETCYAETQVPVKQAPENFIGNAVQIVGKHLAVPMIEGQAFTQDCFVRDNVGLQLVSTLNDGMRAVSISIPQNSGVDELLYPGCIVDVIASFKFPANKRDKGDAISTTLLQGIQVLAVQDRTVIAQEKKEDSLGNNRQNANKNLLVTLMVTPKQAEVLQLMMVHGSVSLAMRNPNDTRPVDAEATLLSEGRLAQLASVLTPEAITQMEQEKQQTESVSGQESDSAGTSAFEPLEAINVPSVSHEKPGIAWKIQTIRGDNVSIEEINPSEK